MLVAVLSHKEVQRAFWQSLRPYDGGACTAHLIKHEDGSGRNAVR